MVATYRPRTPWSLPLALWLWTPCGWGACSFFSLAPATCCFACHEVVVTVLFQRLSMWNLGSLLRVGRNIEMENLETKAIDGFASFPEPPGQFDVSYVPVGLACCLCFCLPLSTPCSRVAFEHAGGRANFHRSSNSFAASIIATCLV